MSKKILKAPFKAFGSVGNVVAATFGAKKKKAAAPVEGQPIVTPLNQTTTRREPRRRPRATLGGTVIDDRSSTLGG